jgi:hypothetical protein
VPPGGNDEAGSGAVAGSLVLVTVHGIGFQQPPTPDGRPGYADALHASLRVPLGDRLGEDPNRPGGGPVYVRSEVDGSRAEGLARLARDRPLMGAHGEIAHVALVYSPSEPLAPRAGAVADALARAVVAHEHYTSAVGALRLVLGDAWAALHERQPAAPSPTLQPRTDLPHEQRPPSILHALEDDVATYVARNDLRERVRGFVQAALVALLDRPDVEGVVVNAHSQGTVVCWDVLCRLPLWSWRACGDRRWPLLRALVTAGSPIRKYVDLFAWGEQVGQMAALLEREAVPFAWRNFWDPHDPVADPLDPAATWRPGDPLGAQRERDPGLLLARDPDGAVRHMPIDDVEVDNVGDDSPRGGLKAHDYWGNDAVVAALAVTLRGER